MLCCMCEVSLPSPPLSLCALVQGGWTALHHAAHKQNVQLIRLLLEHNADANLQNKVAWGDVDAHMCVGANGGGMRADWG